MAWAMTNSSLGTGSRDVRMLAALFLMSSIPAAATPVPADEVRAALADTAKAIAEVALDGEGRARGDYNWKKGSWSEYEPLWHSGQRSRPCSPRMSSLATLRCCKRRGARATIG